MAILNTSHQTIEGGRRVCAATPAKLFWFYSAGGNLSVSVKSLKVICWMVGIKWKCHHVNAYYRCNDTSWHNSFNWNWWTSVMMSIVESTLQIKPELNCDAKNVTVCHITTCDVRIQEFMHVALFEGTPLKWSFFRNKPPRPESTALMTRWSIALQPWVATNMH